MPDSPLYAGLDIGTSGARVNLIDSDGELVASASAAMSAFHENYRDPGTWWQAASYAFRTALSAIDRTRVAAIAVDGTSGTMMPVSAGGKPLALGMMYNDPCPDEEIVARIGNIAPRQSAAHGPTSGLAKSLWLLAKYRPAKILHQADWIAGQFSGRWLSDHNNALKTGFDPVAGNWPDWIEDTGLPLNLLPPVLEPGTISASVTKSAAEEFGIGTDVIVVAGTTDGCASFLATGAENAGDGVTALGTTLTLKILSAEPIFAPESGIYSHKILGNWLAGGASNTGGNVLLEHFTADEISSLSEEIDPDVPSDLDYYPLARPGERFPIADPALEPRIDPRPESPAEFLKGMLTGIAQIEALGYRKLSELGAPALNSVRSVGGGAKNTRWSAIRQNHLHVPMLKAQSEDAAYGAALLARRGVAP